MAPVPAGTARCMASPRKRTSATAAAKSIAPGGHQGAVLAEAVAGEHVGPGPPWPFQARQTAIPAASIAGWVRSVSDRRSSGPCWHSCPEVVAQHRRRFGEGLADDRLGRRERRQHAHRLRALAREHHCQLQGLSLGG